MQVEWLETRSLLSTFLVTNAADSGAGSLRQAIIDSNASVGVADSIQFSIASAVQTIGLLSALPTITDPTTIDATTQPGFAGSPIIELDGSSAGAGVSGLLITAGSTTVRGLVINRFDGDGIGISGSAAAGNVVQGNFIGTDVTGTVDLGNRFDGVYISGAPSNTIGGSTAADRNVISGNNHAGVDIEAGGATGNVVQGNYIGTDVTGTVKLGNGHEGVFINGAPNNRIGGTTAGTGNLISGNLRIGVFIGSIGATGNVVQGNHIGTDRPGSARLGNDDEGVRISNAPGNTIGGTAAGARNVISGNDDAGILIDGSDATGNAVQGNFIGTDASGAATLANSADGVRISGASNNAIGGSATGAGNIIARNGGAGVMVDSGTGNSIRSNAIFSNQGLEIDLTPVGVTANDAVDADDGANHLQNYPVLTEVTKDGTGTAVEGLVSSTPDTTFTVEFFSSTACDASGRGEGRQLLGSTSVATDSTGNASFEVAFPIAIAGSFFAATVTDPDGNTSEFSRCISPTAATIDADATTARPRAFRFIDADGNRTTVRIIGPGSVEIVLNGPSSHADIQSLRLRDTNPLLTYVSVSVAPGAGTDNETDIGVVEGSGLKRFIAANSDLLGYLHLTGALGQLTLDDVQDGADIVLGGTAADRLNFTADQVGDMDLVTGGVLARLSAGSWRDGSVRAVVIETIQTRRGALGADVVAGGQDPEGVSVRWVSVKGGDFTGSLTMPGALGTLSVMSGDLDATVRAGRVDQIVVRNGDARLNLTTTHAAATLGTNAALGSLSIVGGNWLGGTIDLQAGTRAGTISVKPLRGAKGHIAGPVSIDEALGSFSAQAIDDGLPLSFGPVGSFAIKGDIGNTSAGAGSLQFSGDVLNFTSARGRYAVSVQGNLGTALVDRVLSQFDIVGSLMNSFQTASMCDPTDLLDGSPVTLHNLPGEPAGTLSFGSRAAHATLIC